MRAYQNRHRIAHHEFFSGAGRYVRLALAVFDDQRQLRAENAAGGIDLLGGQFRAVAERFAVERNRPGDRRDNADIDVSGMRHVGALQAKQQLRAVRRKSSAALRSSAFMLCSLDRVSELSRQFGFSRSPRLASECARQRASQARNGKASGRIGDPVEPRSRIGAPINANS